MYDIQFNLIKILISVSKDLIKTIVKTEVNIYQTSNKRNKKQKQRLLLNQHRNKKSATKFSNIHYNL